LFSRPDHFIIQLDKILKTLTGCPKGTGRANPSHSIVNEPLSQAEQKKAARLMRINQTGEIAAQALYQGQALTARNPEIRAVMQQAALEENDHLLWCTKRVQELRSHGSFLNPVWYVGSLGLGLVAGLWGDKWSLGFLAETEKQVGLHLQKHLQELPPKDYRSRSIVQQMWIDETQHEATAIEQGAAELPQVIKIFMKGSAKIMTKCVYYF
jgi:ubiquinone biosynthesis monooxygenase Coq7